MSRPEWTSVYDDRTLVLGVAEVARYASRRRPEQITRKQFCDARAPAGHPDMPAPGQIARRLRAPFRVILRRSLSPAAPDRWLSALKRRDEWHEANVDDVKFCMRAAAVELGHRPASWPEYRAGAQRVLDRDRRRHMYGGGVRLLGPERIVAICGTWQRALDISFPDETAITPEAAPASPKGGRAVSPAEALEWFIDYHGFLPRYTQVERFAQVHGFQLARKRRPWDEIVAEVRAHRTARGRWTPPDFPPRGKAPDPTITIPESDALATWRDNPAERRHKKEWSFEECVTAMTVFLDSPESHPRATRERYLDFVIQADEAMPYPAGMDRYGGFDAIRAEAERRRRSRDQG